MISQVEDVREKKISENGNVDSDLPKRLTTAHESSIDLVASKTLTGEAGKDIKLGANDLFVGNNFRTRSIAKKCPPSTSRSWLIGPEYPILSLLCLYFVYTYIFTKEFSRILHPFGRLHLYPNIDLLRLNPFFAPMSISPISRNSSALFTHHSTYLAEGLIQYLALSHVTRSLQFDSSARKRLPLVAVITRSVHKLSVPEKAEINAHSDLSKCLYIMCAKRGRTKTLSQSNDTIESLMQAGVDQLSYSKGSSSGVHNLQTAGVRRHKERWKKKNTFQSFHIKLSKNVNYR